MAYFSPQRDWGLNPRKRSTSGISHLMYWRRIPQAWKAGSCCTRTLPLTQERMRGVYCRISLKSYEFSIMRHERQHSFEAMVLSAIERAEEVLKIRTVIICITEGYTSKWKIHDV